MNYGLNSAAPRGVLEPFAAEHRRFTRLLALLEGQMALFHDGGEPDYELLQKLLFYLTSFSDRFHHPKEDLLFVMLAERFPPSRPHVEELHRLHKLIADDGALFLANVAAVLGESVLPRAAIEEPARAYVARYREHIVLEAGVLFPLALLRLRADDWTAVREAIVTSRAATVEAPVHDWYRALLRQISTVSACGCAPEK